MSDLRPGWEIFGMRRAEGMAEIWVRRVGAAAMSEWPTAEDDNNILARGENASVRAAVVNANKKIDARPK